MAFKSTILKTPSLGWLLIVIFCMSLHANNRSSPLGVNLNGLNYGSRLWIFSNIFRTTNDWSTNSGELTLRPDGYPARLAPGQEAKAMMERSDNEDYVAGKYTLYYDGEGTWGAWLNTAIISQESGKVVFLVGSSNGNGFGPIIKSTNPNNPIRNVRAYLPGTDESQTVPTFHPKFLEQLKNFKVLRFMDWAQTNHSPLVSWSDRPLTTHYKGIAIEHMIELANTLNADAWFCMPHRATNDFIRKHAQLVKDKLNSHLRIYIEYSNEVWNENFTQQAYCDSMGQAAGYGASAHHKYYAHRSVQIFKIWEEVFGGRERLYRVLSSQSNGPGSAETICSFENAGSQADMLSVAPYFGNDISGTNVTTILNECEAEILGTRVKERTAENKIVANKYGLRLIAYEAGQHLTQRGASEAQVQAFIDANKHARMGELYSTYLNTWKQQGGTLMCMFSNVGTWSKYGCWGLMETVDQDPSTSPKFLAVQKFISTNNKWWTEIDLKNSIRKSKNISYAQLSNRSGSQFYDLQGRRLSEKTAYQSKVYRTATKLVVNSLLKAIAVGE